MKLSQMLRSDILPQSISNSRLISNTAIFAVVHTIVAKASISLLVNTKIRDSLFELFEQFRGFLFITFHYTLKFIELEN